MCGAKFEDHHKHSKGTSEYISGRRATDNDLESGKPGEQWSEKFIHQIKTDAFGEINFINEKSGGHKPSKYIRLAGGLLAYFFAMAHVLVIIHACWYVLIHVISVKYSFSWLSLQTSLHIECVIPSLFRYQ